MALRQVRDAILLACDANVIEAEELFPYWKAPKLDLDGWDNIECKTELRFEKSDLALLLEALRIPEKFVCPQ